MSSYYAESTFTPSSLSCLTSFKMESMGRDLSLPLVNGTMQKAHILLHPLITLMKARWSPLFCLTGRISAYVSSIESCVLILKVLSSTNYA